MTQVPAICPFCGLLCDDLVWRGDGLPPAFPGAACGRGENGFAQAAAGAPRVAGRETDLGHAVAAAAQILAAAQQPLIGGLATDVAGMRAVLRLADRCGALLDHMNSAAKLRNLLALQEGGWITTTLTEVRNRADLLVLAGTDAVSRFPRFFERCVWVDDTLFGAPQRDVVYLGAGLDTAAGVAPHGQLPLHIPCDIPRLGEAAAVLRALLAGRRLDAESAAGVPLGQWRALADRLRSARYAVIVWAAADLDFPHAELTVRGLCELVKDMNRSTRAAGLPLGGSDGDFTADGVELWQTGLPFRSAFGSGAPEYDPYRYGTERLLARGEADALVWIASLDQARAPPHGDVPTVVLARPGMRCPREPEVFIPVGTPGLDHAGHLLRADKVVILPLPRLRDDGLPSVATVVAAIEEEMGC